MPTLPALLLGGRLQPLRQVATVLVQPEYPSLVSKLLCQVPTGRLPRPLVRRPHATRCRPHLLRGLLPPGTPLHTMWGIVPGLNIPHEPRGQRSAAGSRPGGSGQWMFFYNVMMRDAWLHAAIYSAMSDGCAQPKRNRIENGSSERVPLNTIILWAFIKNKTCVFSSTVKESQTF